jgi:dTDP-4-amino-4,6-dideoxygalactose transaminase
MDTLGVGTFSVTDRMRQLVNEVLDTGRISYGPMSRALESQFALIHESPFAVLSNSGTSSLQVALQALKELHGWRDGDEVIVPAVTFVATVNVVLHNRLTPILVDVDPLYYAIDPYLIERVVTPRTRAILPVHLFGQPANMTAIMDLARRHDLKVVEDSCECMFVRHAGQMAGSFGEVGCFSTYVAHLLTTGVGGLGITANPDLAGRMRSLVNHGRDGIYLSIDDDDETGGAQLKEIVSRRFNFEHIGHSFRITELEAALGLAQLETWPAMIAKRQRNAARLTEMLSGLSAYLQLPHVRPDTEHAFMMFAIVLLHEDKRNLTENLEARGIETREMLPLTNQPAYRGLFRESDYPVAEWINRSGLYIGCHQDLNDAHLEYIADAMHGYFDQMRAGAGIELESWLTPLTT